MDLQRHLANHTARAMNAHPRIQRLGRALGRRHAARLSGSAGDAKWFGAPVLVLETIGRRSGERRRTPTLYLRDGERFVLLAANGGSDRVPAWWHNLQAGPEASVVVAGQRLAVRAREEPDGPERDRLLAAFTALYPALEDYRRRMTRHVPVVVLERA